MLNKSKKDYAYTLIDADGTVDESIKAQLEAIEGVIKVRCI